MDPASAGIAETPSTANEEKFFTHVKQFLANKKQQRDLKCPDCWLLSTAKVPCLCPWLKPLAFSPNIRFLVFMHYKEYFNAGDDAKLLFRAAPSSSELFIFGVAEDHERLKQNLTDPSADSLILFPDQNVSYSPSEFLAWRNAKMPTQAGPVGVAGSSSSRKLNILVLDGTWNMVKSMRKWVTKIVLGSGDQQKSQNAQLHSTVPTVKLDPQQLAQWSAARAQAADSAGSVKTESSEQKDKGFQSLYQRKQTSEDHVSTVEAVALLLRELGEAEPTCAKLAQYVQLNAAAISRGGGVPELTEQVAKARDDRREQKRQEWNSLSEIEKQEKKKLRAMATASSSPHKGLTTELSGPEAQSASGSSQVATPVLQNGIILAGSILPNDHLNQDLGEKEEMSLPYAGMAYWENLYQTTVRPWYCHFKDFAEEFKKFLSSEKGPSILELGCGNSSIAREMYEHGYKRITAVDFSPTAIVQNKDLQKNDATKRYKGIRFVQMDCKALTFPDRRFDCVIEKALLDAVDVGKGDGQDTLPDVVQIASEAWRVLKTRGLFVIITSRSISKRLEFLSELKENNKPFEKVAALSITGSFVHWRDGTKEKCNCFILRKLPLDRSKRSLQKGSSEAFQGGRKRRKKQASKSPASGLRRSSRSKATKNYAEVSHLTRPPSPLPTDIPINQPSLYQTNVVGIEQEEAQEVKLISGVRSLLYCLCRQPSSKADKLPMIACDGGCNGWFHFACLGLTAKQILKVQQQDVFVCPECEESGVTMATARENAANQPPSSSSESGDTPVDEGQLAQAAAASAALMDSFSPPPALPSPSPVAINERCGLPLTQCGIIQPHYHPGSPSPRPVPAPAPPSFAPPASTSFSTSPPLPFLQGVGGVGINPWLHPQPPA